MDRASLEQQIAALRSEIDAARREILAELHAIRESLPRRAPGNDAKLAALLDQLVVGRELTSRRLLNAAEDRKSVEFRKAVIAISGENPETAADRLGAFLSKNRGAGASGKILEYLRPARDGNLYRVVGVVGPTTRATGGGMDYGDLQRRSSR